MPIPIVIALTRLLTDVAALRTRHRRAARRFSGSCVVLVACAVGGVVMSTPVGADVPKAADVAACNTEAQDAIRPGSAAARGSAVPNPGDQSRAAEARQGDPSSETTARVTRSRDAQLEGMDAEGAKDAAYQAAFRGCMRRNGF
jgi:hypothetical protein